MKRTPARFTVSFVVSAAAFFASEQFVRGAEAAFAYHHPAAKDTYTITSVMQLVQPFDPKDMNDDFQEARVLTSDGKSSLVEVTYYPLFTPTIGENPRWREENAKMTEYLRPTPTENWDEAMRKDLLAELNEAGIDPEKLTDKQVVEQVSKWAMSRSKSTNAFAVWTIHFPDGKPTIYPALRGAFDKERRDPAWTDEQMIGQEILGRSMFYDKVHGSCTSSSVYLTTIFRALGIPTRIVFCIPPFDVKDPKQAELFYQSIHHNQVRDTVHKALEGMNAFANHLFNEVYIDHHWVRLNYSKLGQPILDAHYFGLLTHILTTSDLSKVPLAETWGMRYFNYASAETKMSSSNPYRLVMVRDQFGENAKVDNPETAPPPELTTATISALLMPDAPELPAFVREGLAAGTRKAPDLVMPFKEWVEGTYMQMRVFRTKVGHEFVLSAAGQPDLHASLGGSTWSKGDGSFQAFSLEVRAADRGRIAPGVAYALKPVDTSEKYRWVVPEGLAPVVLVKAEAVPAVPGASAGL